MGLLEGKVAFISGAASGIGAGAARRFGEEGAHVALADVQTEEGQRLCDQLSACGQQALYVTCDVSDADSVKHAIDATVERFGQLDIVFANAGINGVWTPIDELQPDEWDRTLDVHYPGDVLRQGFRSR